ncbi:16S rRNA (guanine(966)-N(2))-methyltransferase RsmD [Merismopedia glauca]|uniref:16S rRNA (Guanine(966)-N(2))-methyltransferase RsmD n=1 Tax=Merismopedia glauca CCAP 1448/3 TaxID=1296344 RepID=A0A2T1C9J5_9CYAN|nr:16S rRNA (guanine(966)-N(2))-methyltransferase RsmD [Merismopedia glauca]PSB04813.1 16S rRNA (guanine(966)-N(2))-methyltransferase RsmD [Merismopedia glauca CCAP 1448/3]
MSLRIYGNRSLKTLPGQATRPTPSRVRQAVFNIWQGRIDGCRWLDLCAGSGSMGAEALCRGATIAVAIEQSSRAIAIITENWQQVVNSEQKIQIIRGDLVKKLPQLEGQQFDRIYFDPPYASELYLPVLQAIAQYQLLATSGELAVEYHPKIWQPPEIESLEICRDKVYGSTAIAFYAPV